MRAWSRLPLRDHATTMASRRPIREAAELPPRPPAEGAASDPLIGTTIADKYRIVRLLARGGVGLVYLAKRQDGDGESDVVVKVLAQNWLENQEALARFEREGQRLGSLQHPNIVVLHECGHDDGTAYIVMEYLVGELLSDYLARKGRLSTEEFVPIAAQILKALGHAHSRGLMHRDIKPSNIMLTVRKGRANFVKILDFGMAKLITGEREVTTEQLVGTANYMAPEQIKGEPIDVRVDVYALGVLFYSMLAGRLPFDGEGNAAQLYKHVHEPPPPLSTVLPAGHGVPDALIEMVHACLAKSPDDRPEDADAMVEALIDSCPASMFHLPVADGSVGVFVSSTSMNSGATPGQAEQSSFDLTRPVARRQRTREGIPRQRTRNDLPRPRTNHELTPPGAGATMSSPSFGSTIIAIETAPPARSWGLVAGAAAAVLAGGLVAAILWSRGESDPAVAVGGVSAERRLGALLDQVEAEILAGEFDKARRHLDGAAQDLDRYPPLKTRADVSRTRIAVASTLASAQRLEKDGNVPAALSTYRDILAIEPHHAEAQAAIARLTEAMPSSPTASHAGDAAGSRPGSRPRAGASGGGRPERPSGATTPAATPAPEPTPEAEPGRDPFLPVAKKDDGGIFLPVGGSK